MTDDTHQHTWVPDGETYTKTEHKDICDFKDSLDPLDKLVCAENCNTVRYRRYTCHCGQMKEVRYD